MCFETELALPALLLWASQPDNKASQRACLWCHHDVCVCVCVCVHGVVWPRANSSTRGIYCACGSCCLLCDMKNKKKIQKKWVWVQHIEVSVVAALQSLTGSCRCVLQVSNRVSLQSLTGSLTGSCRCVLQVCRVLQPAKALSLVYCMAIKSRQALAGPLMQTHQHQRRHWRYAAARQYTAVQLKGTVHVSILLSQPCIAWHNGYGQSATRPQPLSCTRQQQRALTLHGSTRRLAPLA
jgi:hypothetical protein